MMADCKVNVSRVCKAKGQTRKRDGRNLVSPVGGSKCKLTQSNGVKGEDATKPKPSFVICIHWHSKHQSVVVVVTNKTSWHLAAFKTSKSNLPFFLFV